MFDIHTHILPQLDDGSGSWKETMDMIRDGIKDGIKGAVCTSHVFKVLNKELEEQYILRFNELKKRVRKENIQFRLWLGSEININAKFDPKFSIATYNDNKKYMLLELPMSDYPHHVDELLFQLSLQGITPILAHPERNTVIMQKPEIVENLIERDVLIQVNSGSITGMFGRRVRKITLDLINKGFVHFVASDCHSYENRPMLLSKAYKVVQNICGEQRAELLFSINPSRVILGENIDSYMKEGITSNKGWQQYLHSIVKRAKKGG